MGKKNLVVAVIVLWSLMVPMAKGQWDLGSMLEEAKEATGLSEQTLKEAAAANSDAAKQALLDGTAQQALDDAEDAIGYSSDQSTSTSQWTDWVKSNIGRVKRSPAPAPADSGSSLDVVGDIELSPSEPPATASAPSEESSAPSPSPLWSSLPSLSPSPSPSPSLSPSSSILAPTPAPSPSSMSPLPSAEATKDDDYGEDEVEEGPASAPSLAPEAE